MTHTEIETLRAYQDGQRRHVLGILEGLGEEELRRPVLPSGWTCLGLVSHLALDIERFWFRAVVAGERIAIEELTSTGNAWLVPPDVPAREIFDLYMAQIVLANEVIAATPAHTEPAWWPAGHFGGWRLDCLREILLHVITETACHAGHLDAARELTDGRMWRVLT
jgi:Protein of unknown function (DUF664)